MHITMVKKRLKDGQPCAKCGQVDDLLEARGLCDKIDRVLWADEGDEASEGMVLSARHGVEVAPFFLVVFDDGREEVYTSALRMIGKLFPRSKRSVATNTLADLDLPGLQSRFAGEEPQTVIRWALEQAGADCAIAFSGAEDVVLIDMAATTGLPFSVFCLDTGRLHGETIAFLETVRTHYSIDLQVMSPDAGAVEDLVREKGLFSFRRDGHGECCAIRKVEPLKRALSGFRAWMTGQRKDQSPSTRSGLDLVQWDPVFEGREGALLKLNPVADWTLEQVWSYIREKNVPYNPLHDQGYVSIGCEPCTRARRPGEHERAARWWWEDATHRECGLHVKPD